MLMLALVVVGQAMADVPPPSECGSDADCVMSNFDGCCGSCCPPEPSAVSRARLEGQRRRCAIVDCALPKCDREECPPRLATGALRAVCSAGRCVAKPVEPAPPSTRCQSPADCVLAPPQACCTPGCCSGTPRALTVAQLTAENQACGATLRSHRCVAPAPSTTTSSATCRANRCELVTAPLAGAQCRADTDCMVTTAPPQSAACHSSPCGCCPIGPVAVPREAQRLTAPPGPPSSQPRFGLSAGGAAPPVAPPSCSPCRSIDATGSEAVCRGGVCALQQSLRR